MTVLIVDDQISIINGLIAGLDWTSLGITSIHTANNAINAKKILEQEHIDILLCDIEMPGENGLSLLRWARGKKMDFVCVFLTAHADFLYAKEAIQLGCFDYILQPAQYSEIQATVKKAIERAQTSHSSKELKQYGNYAKRNPISLFQNLFLDWIAGNPLSISRLRSILKQLNQELKPNCDCAVITSQLLRWHSEPWTTEEWVFGLNNIMMEIYEENDIGVLFFSIDRMTIGWFLYAPYGHFEESQEPLKTLKIAYERITQYYPCDFAFYITPTVPLEEISKQSQPLLQARKNNVLLKNGIFPVSSLSDSSVQSEGVETALLSRWSRLLYEGNTTDFLAEIDQYFHTLYTTGKINYHFLHTFWLQFEQVVLNILLQKRMDSKQILPLLSLGKDAQSIPQIQRAISAVAAQFELKHSEDEKESLIRQIENFVEENLDQPINVSDVAESLYMNADYLSRIFKNAKNISLKEYIVAEKMRSAQILLQTTPLPISIIASKLGYDNYSYFSQVYRKVMGISPTQERKK